MTRSAGHSRSTTPLADVADLSKALGQLYNRISKQKLALKDIILICLLCLLILCILYNIYQHSRLARVAKKTDISFNQNKLTINHYLQQILNRLLQTGGTTAVHDNARILQNVSEGNGFSPRFSTPRTAGPPDLGDIELDTMNRSHHPLISPSISQLSSSLPV